MSAMDQQPTSPLGEAVERVGDRWALLLVNALLDGPRRFNDLQQDLGGIAPNVLTQRLRHLERQGVVVATPYSQRPRRVVYELTAAGHELAGALRLLAQWGAKHTDPADVPRHLACGTPIEVRWYCPTCDCLVENEAHDAEVHFV